MSGKRAAAPEGLEQHGPDWHFARFVEFTRYKGELGEPSPHLAIVGYMTRHSDLDSKLWLLGCYAATYCLPTAQVLWTHWTPRGVRERPESLYDWLVDNWSGIVTRIERRCVRSPTKMYECLASYVEWMYGDYPALADLPAGEYSRENYDTVWDSVARVKYFGRYINIRLIEGLRRYCGVPARLYDIRSIGGWSPKRALCYLYPEHVDALLLDNAEGNALTDSLARDLLWRVAEQLPHVDEYILAAMLCEYKAYFENYKQYPGWTIDQEPLLYDQVLGYWGEAVDRTLLWEARRELFPPEVLGELNSWNGTRWELTRTLRDCGYVWSDLLYHYAGTTDIAAPAERKGAWDESEIAPTSVACGHSAQGLLF